MFHSIFQYSATSLKKKLTALYILNTLDILFTFSLLKTNLFYEANRFMQSIVQNAFLSILFKLFIPGVFIIYLLFELDHLTTSHLKIGSLFIHLVLLVYLIIVSLHFYYAFTLLVL